MARYRDSSCRLCRREMQKLFLKGDRCHTDKCSLERRSYPPGQHGQRRSKITDYGKQLREKQKVKRMYGLQEKQFKRTFKRADMMRGITGENLLSLLERRLDNTVYRLGFACSRNEARQLVKHGHFIVNGHKVDIPSYLVSVNDEIIVREKSQKIAKIKESVDVVERRGIPGWLELDKNQFKGLVKAVPVREDVVMPIQESLIVELYSK